MNESAAREGPVEHLHRWIPGTRADLTLLMLHGTGGDENDLVPLGPMLAPGASLLSPRGRVLENGMPRFFRRIAEGVFDEPDLRRRTAELAGFVRDSAGRYGFDATRVVAVGFSNGANIAASLMLLEPGLLAGAVLLRAMVPLTPDRLPALGGKHVLIASGRQDPMIPAAGAEALAAMLARCGADVERHWSPGGHNLEPGDLRAAREWFARHFPG